VRPQLAEVEEKLQAARCVEEEAVDPRDFKFFVYLCGGEVEEVPATGLRLTNTEVLFQLGELVVARIPREKVYFAAREKIPVPILF
jgi:hypothetical protein